MTAAAHAFANPDTLPPPLWDPDTRRFDGPRLRQALVARRLTPRKLMTESGLGESTVFKALRGLPVSDATAGAIYDVLDRIAPMSVVRQGA